MGKKLLSADTVIKTIVGNTNDTPPIGKYRDFLYEAIGKNFVDSMDYSAFQKWLFSQTGKTLKEVADEYNNGYKAENLEDLLLEKRFNLISESDKAFIKAFDKAMNELGYDCENIIGSGLTWGLYMIVYGKTETKSRPCAARIYIKEDGEVSLRLFLSKVDKHMKYIEISPAHIKDAFNFTGGDCKSCNTACAPGKVYTIDGQLMQKCNHSTFYLNNLSADRISDYMDLLSRFFPAKKRNVQYKSISGVISTLHR